jgi:hypothetical protein
VAAGTQSDLIWLHQLVVADIPPTVQNGGSRTAAVTSDRHAARLVFQVASVLIDYFWRPSGE